MTNFSKSGGQVHWNLKWILIQIQLKLVMFVYDKSTTEENKNQAGLKFINLKYI